MNIDNLKHDIMSSIYKIGLHTDKRGNIYGEKYSPFLSSNGIWQYPEELTDLILLLIQSNIKNFLNIGTFNGLTFEIIAHFLTSFNPSIHCCTYDLFFHSPKIINKYEYIFGKSNFDRSQFDAVFIDGDHSYMGAKKDWDSVKHTAKIIAFHDIVDMYIYCDRKCDGGVMRLWNEIKKENLHTIEFIAEIDRPMSIMGIGVVLLNN